MIDRVLVLLAVGFANLFAAHGASAPCRMAPPYQTMEQRG
jgi:hypothetical protein